MLQCLILFTENSVGEYFFLLLIVVSEMAGPRKGVVGKGLLCGSPSQLASYFEPLPTLIISYLNHHLIINFSSLSLWSDLVTPIYSLCLVWYSLDMMAL